MLKLRDVMGRWETSELSQLEAAELLGMHERTFRRWARRFEEDGDDGLADRRLGRLWVSEAEAAEVERLYLERYMGFTAKHFHEYLAASHGFGRSYSWTKGFLQGHQPVPPLNWLESSACEADTAEGPRATAMLNTATIFGGERNHLAGIEFEASSPPPPRSVPKRDAGWRRRR